MSYQILIGFGSTVFRQLASYLYFIHSLHFRSCIFDFGKAEPKDTTLKTCLKHCSYQSPLRAAATTAAIAEL